MLRRFGHWLTHDIDLGGRRLNNHGQLTCQLTPGLLHHLMQGRLEETNFDIASALVHNREAILACSLEVILHSDRIGTPVLWIELSRTSECPTVLFLVPLVRVQNCLGR